MFEKANIRIAQSAEVDLKVYKNIDNNRELPSNDQSGPGDDLKPLEDDRNKSQKNLNDLTGAFGGMI
jgi:hypothetical protein